MTTFYEWPDECAFREGEHKKWYDAYAKRVETAGSVQLFGTDDEQQLSIDAVYGINTDGFIVLEDAVSKELLTQLTVETERLMDAGSHLWRDQRLPQSELRKTEAFTAIEQPFINITSDVILDIVFSTPVFYNIASLYMDCPASLSGCNLRKSFNNKVAERETQIYHSDPNSPRFLKMFFYLNDVDEDGGPFQYLSNSYRMKFDGWRSKYRYTDKELHDIYGYDHIYKLTANVGDVIMCDTNGFHRGTKPISRDRTMLTVDWTIHPQFFQPPVFHIRQSSINNCTSWVPHTAFDFLVKDDA